MIAERLNGKFDPASILKNKGHKKQTTLAAASAAASSSATPHHYGSATTTFSDYEAPLFGSSVPAAAAATTPGEYFNSSPHHQSPFYHQYPSQYSSHHYPERQEKTYFEKMKGIYDYLTFQNFILFVIFLVILFFVLIYVYRSIRRRIDWPKYSLVKLETPPSLATTTITAFTPDDEEGEDPKTPGVSLSSDKAATKTSSILSESVYKTPLLLSRPFNSDSPGDYYGTITVSKSQSAKLTVSSTQYFEVVIYTYPSWKIVYAETNINEIPFDFLDHGTYAVVVFSVDSIIGELELTKNTNRLKPPSRIHRITSTEVAEKRDENILKVVDNLSPKGTIKAIQINSSPFTVWPGAVYTRIETLYAVVPDETVAIFGSFPSYGMIVEGADDHLGSLAHEGNSSAVYRIVSKQHETGGYRFVSMTVVYPDISPDSPVSTSPSCCLFIYTSPAVLSSAGKKISSSS